MTRSWKRKTCVAVVATAMGVTGLLARPASASDSDRHGSRDVAGTASTRVVVLDPSTHGNPEGVAFDPQTRSFFVGALGDGTIYRGTTGAPTATVFITGPGSPAVGMKAAGGKLYVAGGPTGQVRVYDIASRALVASFETGAGGFLNDLVVTEHGDVFVTDSFRPTLFRITASQVAAAGGTPEAIDVSASIPFQPGFNLNGIVAVDGGEALIVVQSNTGKLFRVDLGEGDDHEGDDEGHDGDGEGHHGHRSGMTVSPIAIEPLPGGDGLLIDRGRLIVVQGGGPTINFVQLADGGLSGSVVERRTDPSLRTPSTIARAGGFYAVVNADFATNQQPFTVSLLPR